MQSMKSKSLLWIGIATSIIFYMLAVVFELEIFEGFCELMMLFEAYELDEIVMPMMILNVFLIIYLIRMRGETSQDHKKSKIYLERLRELASSGEVLDAVLEQLKQIRNVAGRDPNVESEWLTHLDNQIKEVRRSSEKLVLLKESEAQEIQKIIDGK